MGWGCFVARASSAKCLLLCLYACFMEIKNRSVFLGGIMVKKVSRYCERSNLVLKKSLVLEFVVIPFVECITDSF